MLGTKEQKMREIKERLKTKEKSMQTQVREWLKETDDVSSKERTNALLGVLSMVLALQVKN